MMWKVIYDNITEDGILMEWWVVTNHIKSFRTLYEKDAMWLVDVLNKHEE